VQGAAVGGESVPLLQQQQQQQVSLQDTYYSSRAEALQNVESTIVELGGIFQQLAHMVGRLHTQFVGSVHALNRHQMPSACACVYVQSWTGVQLSLQDVACPDNIGRFAYYRVRALTAVQHDSCLLSAGLQVQEQGEMAVRIDDNVGDTLSNVENAQTQLLKYLNTVSSNRWLVMKIFGILMIFATLFIFISWLAISTLHCMSKTLL
jgi:SNARE domain